MSRTFDIDDFKDEAYEVRLAEPLDNRTAMNFKNQMTGIERWGIDNCRGKFLILVNQVLFTDGRDALIFKLKYG